MKCIESKSGKTVDRVKDDVAATKVATGKWNYYPKEKWKQRVRSKSTSEVETKDAAVAEAPKEHGLKAKDRRKKSKK